MKKRVLILLMAALAAGALVSGTVRAAAAQRAAPSKVRLPDEAAAIDGIVGALIAAYDQFDVVALGEMHDYRPESDVRIALVRHPDFAKKVRTIVVEWGSTREQATLDRYIRGENVPKNQYAQVWKTLSAGNIGDLVSENSIYTDFFAAVREVNSKLPAKARIRVFGGDAGPTARDSGAVSILKEQALQKGGKALVVYGAAHFYKSGSGIVRTLNISYPGRTFAVMSVGGRQFGDKVADYAKFDRALKTQVRPVWVLAQRMPFRDFTAEEFLGSLVCRPVRGGCESIFKGSNLTLGQMADGLVYYGRPSSPVNK